MAQLDTQQAETAVAGGSALESFAAVGAVVLAILGIVRVVPGYMASIGTIVVGAALLAEGGVFGVPAATQPMPGTQNTRVQRQLGGAASAGTFGGAAGVVLGILALLGLAPVTLTAIAVIVFGGALLLSGGGNSVLGRIAARNVLDPNVAQTMRETADTISGALVLAGLAAVALGILALLGLTPMLLVLIALLCVGGALLLSSSAVASAMTYIREH